MKRIEEYEKILETDYPDFSRARRKRRVWAILKFLAAELLALFLIVTSRGATPVLWLLLLLPIFLLKPYRILQRGYTGRIVKREFFVKRRVKGVGLGRNGAVRVGRNGEVSLMTLVVANEKGRIRRIELPARYEKIFEEEGSVLVLSGLPYPVPLSYKEKAFCPLCGTLTPYETGFCGGLCGMPLLELSE
jgi:hypothetical protein